MRHEHSQIGRARTRLEHRAVAAPRQGLGCHFEQNHAAARREVIGHALDGRAQRGRIENVLEHGHGEHEIEGTARIERRGVLHEEPAAIRDTGLGRAPLGFRDHRAAQVDACHGHAAGSEQAAPTTDAASDVERARAGSDAQPLREREPLRGVSQPVIERRHAVRAHGGEALAPGGETAGTVVPVRFRLIGARERETRNAHEACSFWRTLTNAGSRRSDGS